MGEAARIGLEGESVKVLLVATSVLATPRLFRKPELAAMDCNHPLISPGSTGMGVPGAGAPSDEVAVHLTLRAAEGGSNRARR